MTPTDGPWQPHLETARVMADTGMRADAFEMFMAEAARVRLQERSGPVRVCLSSGTVLSGELSARVDEAVEGQLSLTDADDRRLLISVASVATLIGASTELRDESARPRPVTLASRLRECWASGERLRVLLRDGRWIDGAIVLVGADHVELVVGGERWALPFAAGEVWDLGRSV